jgi:hypothetical protein
MKRTALFGLEFGGLKRHGEWSEEGGARQSMKAAARAPILFAVTGIYFFYGVQTKICAYMIASPFTDMRTQMDMPARDLVGYGAHRPEGRWPNGARLAVSVVVNYEEGSERSTRCATPIRKA